MRTRFAPSPTGLLHIGGLRTALYTYLLTKQQKGTFILRIEDTDQVRTVEGALENILNTLHWAGIDPDEGVMMKDGVVSQVGDKGPYIQSERFDIYKEYAQKLIDSGHAYYAFDTTEELDQMRSEQQAHGVAAPKYDLFVRMKMKNSLTLGDEETKRRIDAGEPYVIRLNVPEGVMIECSDHVRGKVSVQSKEVDDTVLLKSDGFPTYHLASVVDDHLMEVDFVVRGEEWLPSLPKHLLLYDAFGWDKPEFAHLPLLLNKGGGKLSKRQNDVAVQDYIDKGYLREALLNFVAMLGWNPGTTQEIFTLEEMIEQFSTDRIQKGGAVFDLEKLDWLQGQWMRSFTINDFAERARSIVAEKYPAAANDQDFEKKAALIQDRITFFHEAPEMFSYFYEEPKVTMEVLANKKQKVSEGMVPEVLQVLIDALASVAENNWNEEHLKDLLSGLSEEKGYKRGQILWPLRAALTGLPYSPGAFEVAAVLGKGVVLTRLQNVNVKY